MTVTKGATLTIRFRQDVRDRLDAAIARQTYPPTVTAVIERGVHLALEEMERMRVALELEHGDRKHG